MFFWAQTLNTDKHSQLFRVDADLWLGNVVITTLSPGCEKITSIPSFFILPFCITLNMLFGAVGAVDIGKNMPTKEPQPASTKKDSSISKLLQISGGRLTPTWPQPAWVYSFGIHHLSSPQVWLFRNDTRTKRKRLKFENSKWRLCFIQVEFFLWGGGFVFFSLQLWSNNLSVLTCHVHLWFTYTTGLFVRLCWCMLVHGLICGFLGIARREASSLKLASNAGFYLIVELFMQNIFAIGFHFLTSLHDSTCLFHIWWIICVHIMCN